MTTRSFTDGDEIPSQPAVRTAWDAVKSEVTLLALNGGTAALNVALVTMNAVQGHPVQTALWAVCGVINTGLAVSRTARTIGILKNIRAPNP